MTGEVSAAPPVKSGHRHPRLRIFVFVVLALVVLFVVTAVVGCTQRVRNARAQAPLTSLGYRFANTPPLPNNSDEVFVILAFSGGGTRAAAFSFGALEELRELSFSTAGGSRSLLDEVDIISSISGGSFTAAYYGLNRDSFFATFPDKFLYKNVTLGLALSVLNPVNWPRLASPYFDRIDLAAEYYDEQVYDHKTFKDLAALHARPFIMLNATDMTFVSRFEFTQDQFDFLGSDLASYPIARGVAASSAFPVLLTPMTVYNYQPASFFSQPQWVNDALANRQAAPREYATANVFKSYLSAERPFLHLMDGGLADNIGLRGPAYALTSVQNPWNLVPYLNTGKIKYLVVITVNAKPFGVTDLDRRDATPGLLDVFSVVANGPMGNYSDETVQYLADLLEVKRQNVVVAEKLAQLQNRPAPVLPVINFYAVELTFQDVPDPGQRAYLNGLATSFNLPRAGIEALRTAARQLLRESPEIKRLLSDLSAAAVPVVPATP